MTDSHHDPDHDRGLSHDLSTLAEHAVRRRALLKWGVRLGLIPLVGCAATDATLPAANGGNGGAADTDTDTGGADDVASDSSAACAVIPEETGGPFPGDGTNGANALALSGITRSDIRASIAGATGVAAGVPLTVTLTVVDAKNGCTPIAGYAVYIWHCDRDGNYSMYSADAANENYLRGVQETDENGQVTFTTIFPGCYSGRWPHIHFEVYPSLASATSGQNAVATSQLAMPADTCKTVFATTGYEASVPNFAGITLATDMVFADGATLETPDVTGNVAGGFGARLTVGL
jgi:protocatechuate 3,4-dioxygenase beta subunit